MNRYQKPKRYFVRVDRETYERLAAYGKEQGLDVKAIVEACVKDIGVKP